MADNKQNRAKEIRKLLDGVRKESGEYVDMQHLLSRYATERFLYRVGTSRYESQFVLTGWSFLAYVAPGTIAVPKTVEFHVCGKMPADKVKGILRDIAAAKNDDGVTFVMRSLAVREFGAGTDRPGFECTVPVRIDTATASVLISIFFGRAIVQEPRLLTCPSLLFPPRPKLRAYPKELMAAEAMLDVVRFGVQSSDLGAYLKLWLLIRRGKLSDVALDADIKAVFARQRTPVPNAVPEGLSEGAFSSRDAVDAWAALIARHGLPRTLTFGECCAEIARALFPHV
jgi:hypothetical protein